MDVHIQMIITSLSPLGEGVFYYYSIILAGKTNTLGI